MDSANTLLNLPLGTLIPLGAGYICYRTAFVGRDAHHKQMDTLLIVVVFAAVVKAVSSLLATEHAPDAGLLIGSWCGYVAALAWRRHLRHRYADALRDAGYGDHDGQPSAWRSMLAAQLQGPTRLVVYLKDGRRLMSGRLSDFNEAPLGPCLLGEDGSIGIYVTEAYEPDAKEWVKFQPFDPQYADWGYEMTIIPASEISRVEVSRPI